MDRVATWTTEIRTRRDRDQALRARWRTDTDNPDLANEVAETDRDNSIWLAEVLGELGQWPRLSEFGEYFVFSCWLLAQRAEPDFQESCLEMMPSTPSEERIPANFAYLIDRVMVRNQGVQVYGTQVNVINGVPQLFPVCDPDDLDARRASVGLGPIAEYLKLF
jgi:hypothetical protein